MVLVGKVNKDIVLRLNRHGQPAVGLCGDDGRLFLCERTDGAGRRGHRLRRADRPASTSTCCNHIADDYIPVIASVGADREGHSYNVNADEAAGAVARALRAYKVDVPDRRRPAGCATRPTRGSRDLARHGATRSRPRCGDVAAACAPSSRPASTRSTAA